MNRFNLFFAALILVAMIAVALPQQNAYAQDGGSNADAPIILNDATPSLDVLINLPPDATGVVALEIRDVVVRVLDQNGAVVFESNDPRIQALEFRIAPNMPQQQLIVERAPGVATGIVHIHTRLDLSTIESTEELVLVDSAALEMGQERDAQLNQEQSSETLAIRAMGEDQVNIAASFPGAALTWQLIDNENIALATLYGSAIDGISVVVDPGEYEVSMLNTTPQAETVANVRVTAVSDEVMALIPEREDGATDTSSDSQVASSSCLTTVNAASVNLRSGPGTGYSVLDYAFRNEQYVVGGTSEAGEWVLVAMPDGNTAWMLRSLGNETGQCTELVAYNIPVLDAPEPQISITSSSSSYDDGQYYDDDDYEYDDDDDDDDEYEYDDDDEYEDHDDDEYEDD